MRPCSPLHSSLSSPTTPSTSSSPPSAEPLDSCCRPLDSTTRRYSEGWDCPTRCGWRRRRQWDFTQDDSESSQPDSDEEEEEEETEQTEADDDEEGEAGDSCEGEEEGNDGVGEGGLQGEEEEGGAPACSAESAVDVERDWSLIGPTLHRRLSRVEAVVFRFAPLNRYGDRFQLPDDIRALLVDAWSSRLLTPHLPLVAKEGVDWRARWVLSASDSIQRLPFGHRRDECVLLSELDCLATIIACTERGTCESLDCCWANPLRFIAIDCGSAADGQQPSDLNDALVINWDFDPNQCDNDPRSFCGWDNARRFVLDGAIRAVYRRGLSKMSLQVVARLLSRKNPNEGVQRDSGGLAWNKNGRLCEVEEYIAATVQGRKEEGLSRKQARYE